MRGSLLRDMIWDDYDDMILDNSLGGLMRTHAETHYNGSNRK